MKLLFKRNSNRAAILSTMIFMFLVLMVLYEMVSSPLKVDKIFVIDKDEVGHSVASRLEEEGIISSKSMLLLYLKLAGKTKDIVPGEFLISAGSGVIKVANIITDSQNIYTYRITLVDGNTVKQFLETIKNENNLTGNVYVVEEGRMMPDTYYFTKDDTKESIITRSVNAMEVYLNDLWINKSPDLPYKNKHEALILASMVEKETGVASERNLIAGLFVNRLKMGMKLQSDPTVAYGLGKENADRLKKSDLTKVTPYNTYTKYGLPDGAIANPSREALYAVFHPAKTDYLYFVADGKGGHIFTTNLKDHNTEVAKWRKIEKGRREQENSAK